MEDGQSIVYFEDAKHQVSVKTYLYDEPLSQISEGSNISLILNQVISEPFKLSVSFNSYLYVLPSGKCENVHEKTIDRIILRIPIPLFYGYDVTNKAYDIFLVVL